MLIVIVHVVFDLHLDGNHLSHKGTWSTWQRSIWRRTMFVTGFVWLLQTKTEVFMNWGTSTLLKMKLRRRIKETWPSHLCSPAIFFSFEFVFYSIHVRLLHPFCFWNQNYYRLYFRMEKKCEVLSLRLCIVLHLVTSIMIVFLLVKMFCSIVIVVLDKKSDFSFIFSRFFQCLRIEMQS